MNMSDKCKQHVDSCRFCWMCHHICPIGNATGHERSTARARALGISLVNRDAMPLDDIMDNIYECATCGGCVNVCVTGWDPVMFTKETRLQAALENKLPQYINKLVDNCLETGNAYGEKSVPEELKKKIAAHTQKTDILLLLGADAIYKAPKQAIKAIEVLEKAAVKFTVLEKEPSTGSQLDFLIGAAKEAKEQMTTAAKAMDDYRTVVIYDPADAKVIKRTYKEYGIDVKAKTETFPTRVLDIHENEAGKRKCRFFEPQQLMWAIEQGLKSRRAVATSRIPGDKKISNVWIIGETPRCFAESISHDITLISLESAEKIAEKIKKEQPQAVLWGSDPVSKRVSAQVAAILGLGLCADCTALETDGKTLFMFRPALSGSVIAKIESLTRPTMATVRTVENDVKDIIVCVGYGAKERIEGIKRFADSINAEIAATRKTVDNGILPYSCQVGLTGKTVAPPVYIAIGVSGAVHHIVGMQRAGTVIAINPDKNAPIFDYADYGFCGVEQLFI